MIKGILGKKLGMSQLFKEDGEVVPITLIQTGPCYVMQKKTLERDGYEAVQLGLGPRKVSRINKPEKNHQDKAGKGYFYHLKEVACDDVSAVNEGDEVKVSDIFVKGEKVKVTGISKGKGFQGVVRRHHFAGNPAAHGSSIHRSTGSIGSSADPSKVAKGKRLPGHMGARQVTISNLEVIDVKAEVNMIALKGAIPGARGQLVILKKQEV
jgi:large subunit ribosomal protein L3